MVRVGLIGAGAVGPHHRTVVEGHDESSLVAVCDLDTERAATVAAPCAAAVFADHIEMMEQIELDAVIVNTPHATHLPITLDAIYRGIAALVEKPLGITGVECRQLRNAAATAGIPVVAGHLQTFMPEVAAARAAIDQGRIGQVRRTTDRRATNYAPGQRSPWFFDADMAGGGAMINVGGHCVDRTLFLTGGRAQTVSAQLMCRWGSPVESDADYVITLDNAVVATITLRSFPANSRNEIEVVGDLGTITVGPQLGTVLTTAEGRTVLHESTRDDVQTAFAEQWSNFLGVLAGRPSAIDEHHATHVVDVVTTGYASARQGGASLPVPQD